MIVIIVPVRLRAKVVTKLADISVKIPARGATNAKFCVKPEILTVPPDKITEESELPKPKRVPVPIRPPAMEVRVEGKPEAKGIMAPGP